MSEIFGFSADLDLSDFYKLMARLTLDMIVATIIIKGIYYRIYKNRDYVFSYYLFHMITFFLCVLLRKVPAELGFALALFGVFGILKLRTEQIRVRELTYLFAVIGVALINSIVNKSIGFAEVLATNAIIVIVIALLEFVGANHSSRSKEMLYDRIDLLHPSKSKELIDDLIKRTGMNITSVEVIKYDLLRDSAQIIVQYIEPPAPSLI